MFDDAEWLQDALEQLRGQRDLANTTSVLETIICHCSNIASRAAGARVRDIATRFRDVAITAYATSRSTRAIRDLLEETIAGLESELASQHAG
jgi:hypothetical protein